MNKKVRDASAKKTTRVKAETVERSSGNVFADLGFHDADERLWKAQLGIEISQLIESKAGLRLRPPSVSGSISQRSRTSGAEGFRAFLPTAYSRFSIA